MPKATIDFRTIIKLVTFVQNISDITQNDSIAQYVETNNFGENILEEIAYG